MIFKSKIDKELGLRLNTLASLGKLIILIYTSKIRNIYDERDWIDQVVKSFVVPKF